jgi:hypothetical protein
MNKKISIAVMTALLGLGVHQSVMAAPLYSADGLQLGGQLVNGTNILHVYMVPATGQGDNDPYITQGVIKTDGNLTYNNGSAINQSASLTSSNINLSASLYNITTGAYSRSMIDINPNAIDISGNTNLLYDLSVFGLSSTHGLDNTNGLDNNNSGITNVGAVSGVTTLATSSNASVGGDLSVSGNTVLTGNLTVAGTTTFSSTPTYSNGLTVTSGVASFQGGASVSGGNLNMNNNRVTNVGAGVSGTDAVNMDQLNNVSQKAYAGTANVAAIAGIPALQSDKHFNLGIGYGNYQGANAFALGGNVRLSENIVAKASFGISNTDVTSSVGMGIAF